MKKFLEGNLDKDIVNGNITMKLKKELENSKIFSCLILKDSQMIFEYYKNKKVEQNLQKINSCTKSFINPLIGICLEKGLLKDLHVPITDFFGDIIVKDSDIRKREITIHHLLTMSAGFHWPEFGEWGCFAPMVYSSDVIKFILSRDLEYSPGEKMNYNSGCSHLLGAIIQHVTGGKVEEFAKEQLFRPLGINDYRWYEIQGQNLTADGLRIKTIDMIKLGTLFLNCGVYNGKRLLNSDWIEKSIQPLYQTYTNIGSYGYHWWVSSLTKSDNEEVPFYFALGYMGQFIIIIPKYQIVMAVTSRLEKIQKFFTFLKEMIVQIIESEGMENYAYYRKRECRYK